ncbi:MAG TPA: carboxylating nicotinate-nucleotide diphosphorylase [Methanotrichaceae archaeon]|nr:carboxylating nicotinate-nucleotide diphosphorylase [Methanotrichaceae archaeon]
MQRLELERFVFEDVGEWDDSSTLVPEVEACASVVAREDCVISGLQEAEEILTYFCLEADWLYDEGEFVPAGSVVLSIRGSARKILQAERLVLNFLARMSGISTLTRECVLKAARIAPGVRVAGTRKTTPGFRAYEKRAVFLGGGDPHRFNLSGAVLIKDNHIRLIGLEKCIARAKAQASFTKKIEVEVEGLDQMQLAADLGADIIMFDNMDPSEIERGVEILRQKGQRSRLVLEASGGITPGNIEAYASTGIDVISMGWLTRNARWIDLSLEME